jgi:hypothetical protein
MKDRRQTVRVFPDGLPDSPPDADAGVDHTEAGQDEVMTRRAVLGRIVSVAAGIAATGVVALDAFPRGSRPSMAAHTPDAPVDQPPLNGTPPSIDATPTTLGEPPTSVVTTPDTTEPPDTMPSTTEAPVEPIDVYPIAPESMVEGQLLGTLSVTNPDGAVIIPDLSLIANLKAGTNPSKEETSSDIYNAELHEGAIVEVRRSGLHGREVDSDREQGIFGDKDRITTIFGHRMSDIQDKITGQTRKAFENLDLIVPGATLTVKLVGEDGSEIVCTYECLEGEVPGQAAVIYSDVQSTETKRRIRYRDTTEELVQLLACHPKHSVQQRISCVFRRIS